MNTEMILLNAITPITFVALYQLILGNLFLGVLESFLVNKLFKKKVSYLIIICANYVSAIAGFLISCYFLDPSKLNMIRSYENGIFSKAMFAYTGIAFIVTLFVELPFYYLGIRNPDKTRLSFMPLLKIVFVVNFLSYIVTILTWLIFV
jgi:hypothetical protein